MPPILTGLRGYFTLAKEMQEGDHTSSQFPVVSFQLFFLAFAFTGNGQRATDN